MPNEKKKTASKKASGKNSRKPNTTVDKNSKINRRGTGTQSQRNISKGAGVSRTGAARVRGTVKRSSES